MTGWQRAGVRSAAAILRNLDFGTFVSNLMKLQAEGLVTAELNNDKEHVVRLRVAIEKMQESSNDRDLRDVLFGVLRLLIV